MIIFYQAVKAERAILHPYQKIQTIIQNANSVYTSFSAFAYSKGTFLQYDYDSIVDVLLKNGYFREKFKYQRYKIELGLFEEIYRKAS